MTNHTTVFNNSRTRVSLLISSDKDENTDIFNK